MDRRTFVRLGAAAGVVTMTDGASWPGAESVNASAPAQFELEEKTMAALQDGMATGRYTARSLVEAYLQRIAAMDQGGPGLRSIIETNPDALVIADRLDAERKQGRVRGPLHGIPVVVKDNLDSADRMATAAGSLALAGSIAPRDSHVVERLRTAGAVLLGKANLSEWANFRSTHSTSGWSGRGGQCRNPYALDRSPCGSSSGTGAAVSANLAAVGVGTETDGSVVCPSSANGVVGIKPTLGLVSRAGIIPISHSQDTAGPMARTVADAATLLGAMAGTDPRDPATTASRDHAQPDYTRFLDPAGLRGARIGVARSHFFGYSRAADRLVEDAINAMQREGATIVDPADIPHIGEYDDTEMTVLLYEFKADLNAYLATLGPGAPMHTLHDLISYNETHRDQEMRFFGQELFLEAAEKGPLTEQEYLDALAKNHRLSRTEGIDAIMDRHQLDALVAPTGSPAWTIDLVNGDHFLGASSTPAAVAGYASISIPVGYAFGLPVGISFIGRAWSEPTLIKLTYALEEILKVRRPPRLLPTADLSAMGR